MAERVHEIMNRELFWVRPDEQADDVLGYILALGITGVPVLDRERHPVGMVSFRELAGKSGGAVKERMHTPALSVREDATIDTAARMIAQTGFHRLPVVDREGHATGVVSVLDVLRGLIGEPVRHPQAFPHYDAERGLVWTDDVPLDADRVEAAPDAPGVLLLVHGAPHMTDRVVWAEAARNLRNRLLDIVSLPQGQPLARILDRPGLRFRAAALPELERAQAIADAISRRAHGMLG